MYIDPAIVVEFRSPEFNCALRRCSDGGYWTTGQSHAGASEITYDSTLFGWNNNVVLRFVGQELERRVIDKSKPYRFDIGMYDTIFVQIEKSLRNVKDLYSRAWDMGFAKLDIVAYQEVDVG